MKTALLAAGALAAALALVPTLSAQDLPGRALLFDGVDDVVRVPFDPTMDVIGAVTIEAWVQPFAPSGGIAGLWGYGGAPDKVLLYLNAGQLVARLKLDGVPGQTVLVGPALPLGAWTHVALTYDGSNLTLLVNAEPVAQVFKPGAMPSEPIDLRMGIQDIIFPGPIVHFDGRIDEVRLWRRALTPAEMPAFANQTVAPDASDLVGSWRFDGATGEQMIKDRSANGNDGTLGIDAIVAADDPTRVSSDAPMRWDHMGQGLAGTAGVPQLHGLGSLVGGTNVGFSLEDALPGTFATFVLGISAVQLPFKGGTLVPSPDILLGGLPTDAAGEIEFSLVWPPLPPFTDLYFQYWIQDAAAPVGLSASNGLWAEMP